MDADDLVTQGIRASLSNHGDDFVFPENSMVSTGKVEATSRLPHLPHIYQLIGPWEIWMKF